MRRYLGTTEISTLISVSDRTIRGWIDSGRLKGFRIPPPANSKGKGHRRVAEADLDRFLVLNGMPDLAWYRAAARH